MLARKLSQQWILFENCLRATNYYSYNIFLMILDVRGIVFGSSKPRKIDSGASQKSLKTSWEPLGSFWRCLGGILGRLERFLARLGGPLASLGASWSFLVTSWASFRTSWGVSDAIFDGFRTFQLSKIIEKPWEKIRLFMLLTSLNLWASRFIFEPC